MGEDAKEIGETITSFFQRICDKHEIKKVDDVPLIFLYKYFVQTLIFSSQNICSELYRDANPDIFEHLLLESDGDRTSPLKVKDIGHSDREGEEKA